MEVDVVLVVDVDVKVVVLVRVMVEKVSGAQSPKPPGDQSAQLTAALHASPCSPLNPSSSSNKVSVLVQSSTTLLDHFTRLGMLQLKLSTSNVRMKAGGSLI